MDLAGYVRVSTEGQVDAFGKDVQISSINRWAELNGHRIVDWFEEDGVSGKIDGGERPVLRELLAKAADIGAVGMVAFDSSRIARRLVVQETLINLVRDAGLRVFTTTADELGDDDDPTRILIRQVLGVIAEFDHRTTVKRLHGARTEKAAQGGYIGGTPPYGLKVDGTGKSAQLVIDLLESRVIEEILGRRKQGETLNDIAESLNRREIPTKRGKKWAPPQIARIVQRNRD